MELSRNGVWWGSMSEAQLDFIKQSVPEDFERLQSEGWSEEWADRRQELVFIGQRMDEAAVRALLDSCLVTDPELEEYRGVQAHENEQLAKLASEGSAVSAPSAA